MNRIIIFFFLFKSFYSYSQQYLPVSNCEVINHTYYTLSYSELHEQAEWVHYRLSPEMINGSFKRTNNFRQDKKVSTGSATSTDYRKSGYERGHLAPAADMKLSYNMMSESFLLSNISPQNSSFNKGGWKKLEKLVRSWASKSSLYITTGGILTDSTLNKIGRNNVAVPARFYKIIFDPNKQEVISFIMPNSKISNDLDYYIVTVDAIEEITGIDFLSELDDKIEDKIESKIDVKNFKINP
jgi:endonuclease G, mitochondrial